MLNQLKADIGSIDVFKISLDGEEYYFELGSRGILLDGDMCYYGSNDKSSYTGEVEIIIKKVLQDYLRKGHAPKLYKELHVIHMEKFKDYIREDNLYLLKGQTKELRSKEEIDRITFENAFNGNTVGYTYTTDLNRYDNSWIDDYELEKLFEKAYDECIIGVYSIKGNVNEAELEKLKKEFESINSYQDKEYLFKLYQKNIIVIGTCSC